MLVAPIIPQLNDKHMEAILEAAAQAGAATAGWIMLRLPLEIAPLFRAWLDEHFPLRAAHIMSLVQQMRGGRDYVSNFGERMRGTGAFADLIEKRFDLQLGADFESDLRRLTEQRVAAEAQPIAHVREALIAIDLPLAVASNSRRHNVEASLRRAGLAERIAGNIFSADMVAAPKPAPDVYLLAAERMGVAPGHCIVIEDSPTGVLAARTAGTMSSPARTLRT